MTAFYFNQDAGPNQWSALPREFKIGDKIYEYIGYDYGVARDDRRYTGVDVVSCSLSDDNKGPFFTVPRYMLSMTAPVIPVKLTPDEEARIALRKLESQTPADLYYRLRHHSTIMAEHAKNYRMDPFDRDMAAAMADMTKVMAKLTLT